MPVIFDEDGAIKQKLSGITIDVGGGTVEVPVRFHNPDPEIGDMTYPIIIIDRVDISPAYDRAQSGWGHYPYQVEGKPAPEEGATWDYYAEFPLPYNVDYQVSTLCRTRSQQSQLHGILSRWNRIPPRYGFIKIPRLNGITALELIGGPDHDTMLDTNGKRLFAMHYLVRVQTFFTPFEIQRYEHVRSIHGTVVDFKTGKQRLTEFDDRS